MFNNPNTVEGELTQNSNVIANAVNDPFKIAGDFTSFYEDESQQYYNKDDDTWTAYPDEHAGGIATLGPGLTGTLGGQEIVSGQSYPSGLINEEFKGRMQTDYDRLNKGLGGKLSSMNPNQQAALLSLIHNVGYDTFRFKGEGENRTETNAFRALNEGDYDTFMEEAFDPQKGFVRASGEVLDGLVRRRGAERDLFMKEV